MSKDKSVKATIRHMMTLDIHHPKHVSSTNRQINRLLHKEIQNGSSDKKLCQKLIELTDSRCSYSSKDVCSNKYK